ncbi:acetate--CoA ligase family protein [Streptosporangium sp. NPDC051022]|uniref:acetate--CoA ligase family protein n=1 Tax=Streptosporangium sp. NPDC051022 TaxID=3155752 RepID=UPI003445FF6C
MDSARRSAIHVLLNPRSIAVIGASASLARMSGVIADKLANGEFTGEVFPVNPKYAELHGRRCHPDVASIGTVPDVAIIYLPAEAAVAAARQCADLGVKGLIVMSAGFAEVDERGKELQAELVEIADRAGMALCGPNTAGLANFGIGMVAFGTSVIAGMDTFQRGGVALLSSSGGLATTMLTYLRARRVGLSHLIGLGNEAVTDAAAFLDVMVDDPSVTCVIAVLEAIRDPEAFFAAADRALAAGKPVIVLKQGRSQIGMRAMLTHTGAMGGGHAAFEAACHRHGVVVVQQLSDLADAAMLFTRLPFEERYRLGILSIPGGGKSLSADTASDHGFELPLPSAETVERLRGVLPDIASPDNPLDPTAGFARDSARLQAALGGFWSDESFDIAVLMQSATEPEYGQAIAADIAEVGSRIGKPLVAIWESGPGLENGAWALLHDAGIPLFTMTAAGFAALDRHRAYVRRRAALLEGAADFGPLAAGDESWAAGLADLLDGEGPAVLDAIGVRRPRSYVVTTVEDAVKAGRDIAGPVAVKNADPAVLHKTEAGGVELGVLGDEEVERAFARVGGAGGAPVEIQEMVPAGLEILVGVDSDPLVGPVVTIGYGGVTTEIVADVTRRIVPVSRAEVVSMIEELRCAPLLRGFRGMPVRDEEALIDVVLRISWAAHRLREAGPVIELNPVIVTERGGAVAVDCVVGRLDAAETPGH